tara:strand:- start:2235 stop:2540 length:306 start_codon:yes stop_codon:yes gene_type:complete
MNAQSKRFLPIRVCTGAGCKAWGSEDLIQGLKEHTSQTHERVMLIPTKCLNNCGGGVTLKTALAKKLIKVRNPGEPWEEVIEAVQGKETNGSCETIKASEV